RSDPKAPQDGGGEALGHLVDDRQQKLHDHHEGFPATVLWRFWITSIGIEAILWTAIGLVFGALAEKLLVKERWSPAYA
ncbi:CbtA family protein, partial [Escherichia coli]|uniref:CbtA family protein n=1 Tax=Escherichia coli TaxID=562 RepID=UPI003F464D79